MKPTGSKPIEAKRKFARLHFIERFSSRITKATGSNAAIITAFSAVVLWLFWGLFVNFSENWKFVFIICTTIITFLMVFIIQKSRNKDALAIQLKLNELVAAHDLASNRLVDVENMTEAELKVIQKYYSRLSDFTKNDENLQQSHSIDETEVNHDIKNEMEKELINKL